jgi:hypothetical protein
MTTHTTTATNARYGWGLIALFNALVLCTTLLQASTGSAEETKDEKAVAATTPTPSPAIVLHYSKVKHTYTQKNQ